MSANNTSTSGDISGLANLEALVVDFSRTTSNIYLSDIPKSLRSLQVTDMSWFESDKITDFIETYGGQLKKLYLSGYVYAEKKDLAGEYMKTLLAVIADKCVNLNVLHINYNVAPSVYREFLIQHTNKIGRELTDLDISHAYLSDAVIDSITKYCPKMKKLYLECPQFDYRDTEAAYEKLSSLAKLEDVTLRLRD
ncbi:hypothetical protein HDE_10868 [Halotydeus destructor]|nr:hypothetical protein HDE_10868 [Halotydeus destructor]